MIPSFINRSCRSSTKVITLIPSFSSSSSSSSSSLRMQNIRGVSSSSSSSQNDMKQDDDEINTDETHTADVCHKGFIAPIRIKVRGTDILNDPLFNKGTAFQTGERDRLRFRGMLPAKTQNIIMQKEKFLIYLRQEESNIKKNIMLEDLHDRNETLYHRVLVDHIEEMAPLIYTPTVGQACLEFGNRYRRARGMYFIARDRGHMAAMVYNWPHKDVHVIVVTDGSRILGLGDLGASGMGIPIGKLSLYCAAGGIAPHRVLPVVLDVGTDNEELRNDPLYLGANMKRLKGPKYFELVDEFMQAVRYRWPNVLIQFEDFNSGVAQTLLDKYRDDHLCFNDDIQGTGATALAGILSALRAKGDNVNALGDQRILIAGAGSAGIGIAQVLKQAMLEQGRTEEEAKNAFFIADQHGLLGESRQDSLNAEQRCFARDKDDGMPLLDIIKHYKPTILIGVTAVGGLFTEKIVREMAAINEKPVIFPLSNPTLKAECTAEQAFEWTDGRCVFASGSPFDSVDMPDGRVLRPSQCNNMYIFPGLGLGVTVCGAEKVTDRMLYVAAEALAKFVSEDDLAQGMVFPPVRTIRDVSHRVAVAVVEEALKEGLATKISTKDKLDLNSFVARKMYFPEYAPLIEKRELEI